MKSSRLGGFLCVALAGCAAKTVHAAAPNEPKGSKTALFDATRDRKSDDKEARATPDEIVVECAKPANASAPYCRLRCGFPEVICVTTSGSPIPSEVFPTTLDPKTTYYVYVIHQTSAVVPPVVPPVPPVIPPVPPVVPPVPPVPPVVPPVPVMPGLRVTETVGSSSYQRLDVPAAAVKPVVFGDGFEAAVITYTMADDATSERIDFIGDQNAVVSSVTLRSNGGRYFFAYGPAIVIPFTGVTSIEELDPPTGSGRRYERTHSATVWPAFMVHVYPFGHRAQSLSPFVGPTVSVWKWIGRTLTDMVSMEAGLNLDPTKLTQKLALGVALEPITGISLSVGTSFNKAERFHNGFSDGAFIANSRADAVEEYIELAPYFGIAVNQGLFTTISHVYSGFASQQDK